MIESPLVLQASAKINLSLRVLGKREDGFHELDMLMVHLPELSDTLTFSIAENWELSCDDPSVPVDESNLVTKAKLAFDRESGAQSNFSVQLKKLIPHGAGLAGGSSDAATTLRALNALTGYALGEQKLHQIAAELGSDVPFFLERHPMRCRGRGEILEKATNVSSLRVLLLKPAFGVSTPQAYKSWKTSKEVSGFSYAEQHLGDLSLVNDLERPVFDKYLFLGELKKWLLDQNGVKAAMMSGSGSTVFAVIEDQADAELIISFARKELDPTLWAWSGFTKGGE